MRLFLIVIVASLISCGKVAKNEPAVISLLGKTYYEPVRSEKVQAALDSALTGARESWEKDPSEENFIWYGRRLGYLSRFNEAIEVFSQGIEKFPGSARLYRHRGHRFITIRQFDKAIVDLNKASTLMASSPTEIEPDGVPNKINKPLSTTQFNVWYHLALAYYLKGDFELARDAYLECLKTSDNDDLVIACVDWLYMTYRRLGLQPEAIALLNSVNDSMTIIENDSYYKRCRMYQGKLAADSLLRVSPLEGDADLTLATQGYGVGNWYLYNGDSAKAKEIFEKVVAGKNFAAFGFIAAEAELARWRK